MGLWSLIAVSGDVDPGDELVMRRGTDYARVTIGQIVAAALVAAAQVPPGALVPYAGATPPAGYLLCDGAEVLTATYPELYAAIADNWGVPSDGDHFVLPDLRGRVPLGVGTGAGLSAYALADTGGEEEHTLSTAELHAHSHGLMTDNFLVTLEPGTGQEVSLVNVLGGTFNDTNNNGSSDPHENRQPYAAVNWLVKT